MRWSQWGCDAMGSEPGATFRCFVFFMSPGAPPRENPGRPAVFQNAVSNRTMQCNATGSGFGGGC
jgi:hypothetical protein